VGDTLFFTADDGTLGPELWKTDGSAAGTVLVKDVNPGDDGDYYDTPSAMIGVGGTLFFTADDGVTGRELWTSDGSEAGTVMVKDINPDVYNSDPDALVAVGDTLFFTARDGVNGRELWTSDGTGAGTALVKDINPGDAYYSPSQLTEVGGTLFFAADDGTHGLELWKSDGSEAGTTEVEDINQAAFTVGPQGRLDTRKGTLRLPVSVESAGRLEVRPVGGSKLRRASRAFVEAGRTNIVLAPTKAGLRELRRTGKLRVRARFTFITCAGGVGSVVNGYTLRLR
jgi:ELWxxDGT repeat protein